MDEKTYRKKVLGCWLGKAVGGTLGAPIEGWDGPHHLEFYDPVPTTMVPNDDLDLQVVWAMTIAAQPKPVVNSQILAEAWLKNVGFPWDEYAVAIRNLKNGIRPPFHGLRPGRRFYPHRAADAVNPAPLGDAIHGIFGRVRRACLIRTRHFRDILSGPLKRAVPL